MEDDEYDELEDFKEGGASLGDVLVETEEDATDSAGEIPFQVVHNQPLEFKSGKRRVFVPGAPIEARITKHERAVTKHLLNPYLYTIELEHAGFTWVINKRYKHFHYLHQNLQLYRTSLLIPFPNAQHRFNRQSFKEEKKNGPVIDGRPQGSLPRFPKKPEVLISYDLIDNRAQQLEDYLNNLLRISLYRNHPDTVQFLNVSHLSFVKGLGVKGMEEMVMKQTGSTRRGCSCFGMLDIAVCTRCSQVCSDTCGGWRSRWFFVKDTFMGYVRSKDGTLGGILLFDQGFEVSSGLYSTGMRNRLQVVNLARRLVFKCRGKRKRQLWSEYMKQVAAGQGYGFTQHNRNSSFAPERRDTSACWFVDGSSYMSAVADAIDRAKEEIFIADWWLSPEIYLKRPALDGHQWRLDTLLAKKACEGVKVFVLLYKEVELALGINSYYSKSRLAKCHTDNVKVLRHPDHAHSGVFLWAHHEKIVCVDQTFAFLGGIDLCYGRWDDHRHRLSDFGGLTLCGPGENSYKKKITSSRPLGSKPRPLVTLVQASNSIGVRTMASTPANLTEAAEDVEVAQVNAELENVPLEHNGEVAETAEEDAQAVDEDIPEEHVKCNTPEAKRRSLLTRFGASVRENSSNLLHKITGDENSKIVEENLEKVEADELQNTFEVPELEEVAPPTPGLFQSCSVKYWVGKDYTNFIVKDFRDLDSPYQDLVDRTTTPRMPWHDIGVMVHGAAARDVARHFIQRWNAVKVEKAKKLSSYPLLMPKSYEHFDDPLTILPDHQHKVSCQVLRSISAWSGGYLDPEIWEESIHEAYVTSITKAEHYVYIENQFFISLARQNPHVKNQIGEAICKRVIRAHKEKKPFRVFVVLPLLPGFEGEVGGASGTALHAITHWNFASMCRGNDSIYSRLQELGVDNPTDYVTFHGLRTHSSFHGDHVTELIYVHSKLMIVDDKIVICGSANINDRSMVGRRDSEIAVLIRDEELVEGRMNGEETLVGKYASSLRKYLFSEHLGLLQYNNTPSVDYFTEESPPTVTADFELSDPVSDSFYRDVWQETSRSNTKLFEEVFRCLPSDRVTTFKELSVYQEEIPLLVSDNMSAIFMISQIKGHLVDMPLNFLMNEVLTPNPKSVEGMMPTSLWT